MTHFSHAEINKHFLQKRAILLPTRMSDLVRSDIFGNSNELELRLISCIETVLSNCLTCGIIEWVLTFRTVSEKSEILSLRSESGQSDNGIS